MDHELIKELLEIIGDGCDLCNSIELDVQTEHRLISDNTILLVNKFKTQYHKLNDVLDILNGVN